MSLIKDVKDEVKTLPLDKKNLRKFGLMIGGIFIAVSSILFFNEVKNITFWMLFVAGSGLFLFGLVQPGLLRKVYTGWMTGAIVMGWFVSRLILTLLFFLVIAPMGVIAKIVGKNFLDINFRERKNSFWISKPKEKKSSYSKMY